MDPGSVMEKFGSGNRDNHSGSATLLRLRKVTVTKKKLAQHRTNTITHHPTYYPLSQLSTADIPTESDVVDN